MKQQANAHAQNQRQGRYARAHAVTNTRKRRQQHHTRARTHTQKVEDDHDILRVRLKIIRTAHIKIVGKYESCMAHQLRILFQTDPYRSSIARAHHLPPRSQTPLGRNRRRRHCSCCCCQTPAALARYHQTPWDLPYGCVCN